MKQWKEKMTGMMALLLCFGLVACSSEESASSSNSGSVAETTVKEESSVDSAVTAEVETEETTEEETTEEEVATLDEETTTTEEAVVEGDGTLDEDKVAEFEAYADEVYDYFGAMLFSVKAMEELMEEAGEDAETMLIVAEMMDGFTTDLRGLGSMTVPVEVEKSHGIMAACLDEMMTSLTEMVYLLVDMLEVMEGYETMTTEELATMVSELERMQEELLAYETHLEEVDRAFTEDSEEIDRILEEYLGLEYIQNLEKETNEQVELEFANIFG